MSRNRFSLCLLAIGLACACLIMTLPVYTFRAGIYTKKSSNTFVGDEKYKEVRAEVEKTAEEYRAQGLEVEVSESVTERTNSKGEKTSLVAFSIDQSFSRNIWSFAVSDLPAARVVKLMAAFMILSLLFMLAGCAGSLQTMPRNLSRPAKLLRTGSRFLIIGDMLLTPVLIFMNNFTFWRKVRLYQSDQMEDGKENFYAVLDRFLFEGKMGDQTEAAVKNLQVEHSVLLWLLLACFFVSLAAAIYLRFWSVKKVLLREILYVFVAFVCVITIYPYYVMFTTAFRSNAETLDMYFLNMLPTRWIWSNLKDIVNRGVPRFLMNSGIIAGGSTLLAMFCGIPAAYAMARMKFRGKKFFLGFVIMSQMFSPVVLLIGISQLMNTIHLNDTLLGLIFINAAFNQAFAIWLLRGTFVAISPEMEQAARIDGCSTIGSLLRVLLPMAAPGIVTTLIFVFINAWNEYTISTVLISTASNRPITVGITQFSSFNMIEWQYLFAASLLATIPVVILFMAIEKHLTSGLTSGGVKG